MITDDFLQVCGQKSSVIKKSPKGTGRLVEVMYAPKPLRGYVERNAPLAVSGGAGVGWTSG
jgi:hypothetical protein